MKLYSEYMLRIFKQEFNQTLEPKPSEKNIAGRTSPNPIASHRFFEGASLQ